MPTYAYRGRNARGEQVRGTLEGADTGAIAEQLFNTGITPVDIRQEESAAPAGPSWWQRLQEERPNPLDVIFFTRQMHTLLRAGVPILRALAGLQESHKPAMARIIQDLRTSLDSGRELSTAMYRHPEVFSAFYVSLVRVGEATGLLDQVFIRLFEHLEFERETRDRIKAALRYPTFVIIAMAIALVVVNIIVIPAFAKVFQNFKVDLPFMTRVLIGVSDLFVHGWPIMLVGLVGGAVSLRAWIASPNGRYRWDKLKLRLPIVGHIILHATLARFARSFALCLKSGIPAVQALSVVSRVADNEYISHRIEQMRDGVERGESVLRTSITTGIFTPMVLQMIAVGDETGELDELLLEVAEMYERDVDYSVKNLAANIEPVLIVFLAILVLILALGVFLPLWDLGQTILKK
ncbi:MAG: type II secretion system F family protein [Betaproteobacteria bacterium]|nr:type II secretion system F family protein [Betaproteobacteria bacterium]